MTSSELWQAAVEARAKSGLYDVENIVRREHYAVKLADHILATVTFDDGEPADFEWLASQCLLMDSTTDEELGTMWWEVGPVSFTCEDYQSDPGEPVEAVATDWQVDGQKLPLLLIPKTRGQFRRLLELAGYKPEGK